MQATRLNHQPPSPYTGRFLTPSASVELRRAPPSQDRPFACPIPTCGGRFHRKFTLNEHMKTHTGEQPHQCPVEGCGKRFSTSGNLARHRKLHAIDKLQCPTPHCSREFTSRDKLLRHLKVHLAGTPHTCTIEGCGKTFSTAGNLTRHRRTRHNALPTIHGLGSHATEPRLLKTVFFPEHQRPFPLQELHPVVPGALLVKNPAWTAFPLPEEDTHSRSEAHRFSDQDVRDLLDCLFVENPAIVAVNHLGGMIRSEPFLRGAYHP